MNRAAAGAVSASVWTGNRWRRTAVVCCLAAGLAAFLAACAGVTVPGTAAAPQAMRAVPAAPVRVLQLNLCNSGIAACYTGRSVEEAARVIRVEAPDVVAVNEICEADVRPLERAMARAVPGGTATSAFQPARDRTTGEAYRCANGERFGIGIVSRWRPPPGSTPDAGIYPVQDPGDPEERAWLCLDARGTSAGTPAVTACTTHLAYTDPDVAAGQCRHLSEVVVARLRDRDGAPPVVLAGDLNLARDDPRLEACLPPGATRADDGAVQYVVGASGLAVADARTIELRVDTEHPGLLVALTPN